MEHGRATDSPGWRKPKEDLMAKKEKEKRQEEVEADKKVEITDLGLAEVWPGQGKVRAFRDLRFIAEGSKKAHAKMSVSLPIPETDEEAKAWYNTDLATLARRAVVQTAYGADGFVKTITNDTSSVEKVARAFEEGFFKVRMPSVKTAETKAVKAEADALGMSPLEAMKAARAYLAVKAGYDPDDPEQMAAFLESRKAGK